MTRIAVVGAGMMGMLHARTFRTIPDVEVVALDIDSERRAIAERELGVATAPSLEAVIDEVDAVSVTLPDHLHVEACVTALTRDKYVLVEKPLATSVADGQRILAAQRTRGRLMVGHVLRHDLRLQELKRRIEGGELGELRYVRIHRANTVGTARRLGGRVSVVGFLGVHDLDLLLWLTNQDIEHVAAHGRKVHGDTWDVAVAQLDLGGGMLAVVENHWLVHDASARSCLAGVQVFGSAGMVDVDLSTGELEVTTDGFGASKRVDTHNWTHDPQVSGGSLRRQLEAFVQCARAGVAVPVPGEAALRAVAAVEMVESALSEGKFGTSKTAERRRRTSTRWNG